MADPDQTLSHRGEAGVSIDAPDWFSRTWQVTPDFLGVANAEGVFFQVNPAWEAVLGWSPAETAEMSFLHLIHPANLPKTQSAFARLLGGSCPPPAANLIGF